MPEGHSPPQSAKATVDLASKLAASLLISVYAAGFLITSLHTSVYGFAAINPLRPKILAAGAWFLFFVAVPMMLATAMRRQVFASLDKEDWLSLGQLVITYTLLCNGLGFSAVTLFDYPAPASTPMPIWATTLSTGLLVVGLTTVWIISTSAKVHRARLGATIVIVAWFLYNFASSSSTLSENHFEPYHVTVWFFALGVLIVAALRMNRMNPQLWPQAMFIVLVLLGIFARYYYPRIESSWGGGSPVSVVLYLSKDSPVAAGKQLQAILIDESDAGYYIVPAHEKNAIFFPRSAVSLVFFADKTSDSPLLHTGTP